MPGTQCVQAGAESVAHLPQKRVGVISTCFTASTGCYPALIAQLSPEKQVFSRGYKNLAAMVEHGASQQAIDEELRENLDDLVHHDEVECCLLACTHYPLVEDHIHRLYPQLQLVDPADRMAQELERCLKENRQISRRSEREHWKFTPPPIPRIHPGGPAGGPGGRDFRPVLASYEIEKEGKGRRIRRPFFQK